jgi:hypothetical protein
MLAGRTAILFSADLLSCIFSARYFDELVVDDPFCPLIHTLKYAER